MSNVAVIDISQKIHDPRTLHPDIRISEDNVCTITFRIFADSKSDIRQASGKEKGECRDAGFGINLVQNSNKVRVKLVPEGKNEGRATLILEADLETKIPGTGSFLHAIDEEDKLNADYADSKIE